MSSVKIVTKRNEEFFEKCKLCSGTDFIIKYADEVNPNTELICKNCGRIISYSRDSRVEEHRSDEVTSLDSFSNVLKTIKSKPYLDSIIHTLDLKDAEIYGSFQISTELPKIQFIIKRKLTDNSVNLEFNYLSSVRIYRKREQNPIGDVFIKSISINPYNREDVRFYLYFIGNSKE